MLGHVFSWNIEPVEDPGLVSNSFEDYIYSSINIKMMKSGKTGQSNEKSVVILVWNPEEEVLLGRGNVAGDTMKMRFE
jgi:CDP-diacylglycerol pyrophosphatase